MRSSLITSASVCLILGGLGASSAHAAASKTQAAKDTSATSAGWIYYPAGVTFTSTPKTYVVSTGTDATGSCLGVVEGQGSRPAGGAATATVETGYNSSTCQMQYTTGQIQQSAQVGSTPSGTLSESGSNSGSTAAPSGAQTAATTINAAYQDNQWLDPFGIQVNAQEQWVSWTDSGGCVSTWSDQWKWSWYNDGWSKNYGYTDDGASCDHVHIKNYAKFTNGTFCAGSDTHTYFGQHNDGTIYWDHLRGYWNGSADWDWVDDKSSSCSGLLHHGHKNY